MRCPNCDTKIKNTPACPNCGTQVYDIVNASYTKAREVLKNGTLAEKEKVFSTFNTPKELSRKTLILLTVFLGFMAGHDFYVGKTKLALSKAISFVIGNIIMLLVYSGVAIGLYGLAGLFLAYPVAMWVYDIVRVIFKRYPFPVILEK